MSKYVGCELQVVDASFNNIPVTTVSFNGRVIETTPARVNLQNL
jgi:hypothetical protein